MANELLSNGLTYTLVQNRVYALPIRIPLITSSAAVEVSLDGTNWAALANATTGAITGAPFLRSTLVGTIVSVRDASQITVPSSSSSTPGGADTQVQFNNAGVLAGVSTMTYTVATQALRVTALVVPTNIGTSGVPVDTAYIQQLANAKYLGLFEQGSQPAAVANQGLLFTEDNGAGKTRLMVRFGTGAAVQLAIEP